MPKSGAARREILAARCHLFPPGLGENRHYIVIAQSDRVTAKHFAAHLTGKSRNLREFFLLKSFLRPGDFVCLALGQKIFEGGEKIFGAGAGVDAEGLRHGGKSLRGYALILHAAEVFHANHGKPFAVGKLRV